jgi:hypothetical protein
MKTKFFSIALAALLGALSIAAQTGGGYDLSHRAIAAGGAMQSAGGNFKLDGTVGQALAGTTSTGGGYNLHGGFWFAPPLAPTAARVLITGRVSNLRGGIVRRVKIVLTDSATGEIRTAQTSSFGYYRFENVEIGRIYLLQAQSKNFQFTPDMHVFTLFDARDDFDFTAVNVR